MSTRKAVSLVLALALSAAAATPVFAVTVSRADGKPMNPNGEPFSVSGTTSLTSPVANANCTATFNGTITSGGIVNITSTQFVAGDVLTERCDVHVAQHGGVEGVAAQLRSRSGMGRNAVVRGVDLVHGDRPHGGQVPVRRVDHQGGVDTVEGPGAEQELLAPATLLRRRTHDPDPAAELLGQPRQRQPRPESGGGDHVVPAGVAQTGERVVLAQHGDQGALRPDVGDEGRVDPEGVRGRIQPGLRQCGDEDVVGMVLLEAELRVLPDVVAHLHQEVGVRRDQRGDL